jgi:hypothetical protein
VEINDPSRANARTQVTVDDITYTASFNPAGQLTAKAPLFHPQATVTYLGRRQTPCNETVAFAGFASAYLSAIEWKGALSLKLHVVEGPGSHLGSKDRYLSADRRNESYDPEVANGMIRVFGEPAADTSQVQLYTVPSDRRLPNAEPAYYVEFASRGNPASAPYCDNGPDASPEVRFRHVSGGAAPSTGRTMFTQRATKQACGFYFRRDGWQKEYELLKPP